MKKKLQIKGKSARPKRKYEKLQTSMVWMAVVAAEETEYGERGKVHRFYRMKYAGRIYVGAEWYAQRKSRPSLALVRWYVLTNKEQDMLTAYGFEGKEDWKRTALQVPQGSLSQL